MNPATLASTQLISWLIFWASLLSNVNPALSQNNIVPDDTLADESSVVNVRDETSDRIDGGATRGSNLFHSFQEFNVGEGRGAYFSNPDEINNIFSRVTGSNPSNILGRLGVDGAANLYLINPSGIIFGANSSLDVQGSFTATTAHGVRFGEQGTFDAMNPQVPELLTINPTAYFFNQLENHSINGIQSQAFLLVPEGKNLTLLGGDIELSGTSADTPDGSSTIRESFLFAPGGLIELGSLNGTGEVEINESGNLIFPENVIRGNISLSNNSFIFVASDGGGFINIQAQNLELQELGFIFAGIGSNLNTPDPTAGDIKIVLSGELSINNNSLISNDILENLQGNAGNIFITANSIVLDNLSQIGMSTNGSKTPGNISITTNSLEVKNGSFIFSAKDEGDGSSGDIIINATDSITLDGEALIFIDAENKSQSLISNISSSSNREGAKAGDIFMTTDSLNIKNGAFISSANLSTFGGDTGNININANSITLDEETTGFVNNEETIFSSRILNAGEINLTTGSLSLLDGARINSSNVSQGNSGDILIKATDYIIIDGEDSSGKTSGISSQLLLGAEGNAGNIEIDTNSLKLLDGGSIVAFTGGKGKGGDITIKAADSIVIEGEGRIEFTIDDLVNTLSIDEFRSIVSGKEDIIITFNSGISSGVNIGAEGNSGDIKITTNSLQILNRGEISANTGGNGNGGDININAAESIIVTGVRSQDSSSIISSSVAEEAVGKGGDIFLATNYFQILNGGEISASTSGEGKGGNITIEAHSLKLQNNAKNDSFDTLITNLSLSNSQAGEIILNIGNSLSITNSIISSQAEQSIGGNLTITAETIKLRGDSLIRTDVGEGEGSGGDIFLKADSIIAFDDSTIIAFSKEGTGGNITLDTPAFFGENFTLNSLTETDTSNLRNNNRVDINATGAVSGIVSLPDVSFVQNSLTELPNNALNTDKLVANSCVVPNRQQKGTFIITGNGGLATTPEDESIIPYSTGEVQTIEEENSTNWQPGDPIIEPQGVYRLSNGKLILSRECSRH